MKSAWSIKNWPQGGKGGKTTPVAGLQSTISKSLVFTPHENASTRERSNFFIHNY